MNILFVDDSEAIITEMKNILEETNHKMVVARDGGQGRELNEASMLPPTTPVITMKKRKLNNLQLIPAVRDRPPPAQAVGHAVSMKTRALPGDLVAEAPVRAGLLLRRARVRRRVAPEARLAVGIDSDRNAVRQRHDPRHVRMLRLELDGYDRRRVIFVVACLQGSRTIISGRAFYRNTQRPDGRQRFKSFLNLRRRRVVRQPNRRLLPKYELEPSHEIC